MATSTMAAPPTSTPTTACASQGQAATRPTHGRPSLTARRRSRAPRTPSPQTPRPRRAHRSGLAGIQTTPVARGRATSRQPHPRTGHPDPHPAQPGQPDHHGGRPEHSAVAPPLASRWSTTIGTQGGETAGTGQERHRPVLLPLPTWRPGRDPDAGGGFVQIGGSTTASLNRWRCRDAITRRSP